MLLCGASVLLLAALHAGFAWQGHRGLGDAIPKLGLARCLVEFTLGALAARLWQQWDGQPSHPVLSRRFALLAVAGVACGLLLGLPETAFVPLALWAGLLALAFADGPAIHWLAVGPVHWLGQVSYSTYLCHFGLFIVFKLAFVDASLQLGVVQLAGFTGLLLVASAVLYHGIETPAQRAFNALQLPRRRSSHPA